jgi:hypothetical protein
VFRESEDENKEAPPPLFSSFFHLCLLELGEFVFLQIFEGRFENLEEREKESFKE